MADRHTYFLSCQGMDWLARTVVISCLACSSCHTAVEMSDTIDASDAPADGGVSRNDCRYADSVSVEWDEMTALGSASNYFDDVLGTWKCDLIWNGTGDWATVSPDSGRAALKLVLVASQVAPRFLDSVRADGKSASRIACPSILEISVNLTLDSDDGALKEVLEGVARVRDRGEYEVEIIHHPTEFIGSYHFSYVDSWDTIGTNLWLVFWPDTQWFEGGLFEWSMADEETITDPFLGEVVEGRGTGSLSAEWVCSKQVN